MARNLDAFGCVPGEAPVRCNMGTSPPSNLSVVRAFHEAAVSSHPGLSPIFVEVPMMLKTGASVAILTLVLGATVAVAQTSPPAQRPAPTTPAATEIPKVPVTGQILVQDAN